MGRLSIVVLFTPDLARQQDYYVKSLGLTLAASSPRWAQFGTRDAALALRALPAGTAPRIELGFDVPSLDERLAQVASRGVQPVGDIEVSGDCRIARLADPDGNIVQLVERKTSVAAGVWPRLSHAIVNVQAFEACAHFYHDVLGFKLSAERAHWVEYDTGATRLMLHESRDAEGLPLSPDQRVSFALMDDDLDGWADELREKGMRFVTTPTDEELGRMAEIEDADGWFVVLRGPLDQVPIEESLARDYADEDDNRIEQIRKTGSLDPVRPAFGVRKKKVERVVTRGFDALAKQREPERGGSGSSGGFSGGGTGAPRGDGPPRPFTPRPPRPDGAPSRPFTPRPPRPDGAPSRPYTPRPPRPEGSAPPRPFTPRPPRPEGSGPPRPYAPRPDGPRRDGPSGPRPPRPDGPPRPPRREE